MKQILSALILTSILVLPAVSFGVDITGPPEASKVSTVQGIINLIDEIRNYIFTGVMIIAGIFLIVAGFFFITASGDPEKVNKARQMLINALIGVAVALGSFALMKLVSNLLGAE